MSLLTLGKSPATFSLSFWSTLSFDSVSFSCVFSCKNSNKANQLPSHTHLICLSHGLTQCTWTAKGGRFTNNYCTHWISWHVWWGLQGQSRKRDSICKDKEWKLQKTKTWLALASLWVVSTLQLHPRSSISLSSLLITGVTQTPTQFRANMQKWRLSSS